MRTSLSLSAPAIRDIVAGGLRRFPLARMMACVDLFERVIGDVGVDLGRRHAPVPKQFLHTAEVGTASQELSGKAMTQGVWRWAARDARSGCILFDNLSDP